MLAKETYQAIFCSSSAYLHLIERKILTFIDALLYQIVRPKNYLNTLGEFMNHIGS